MNTPNLSTNGPIHVAAMNGNKEIVEILLEHRVDFMVKNHESKTCLDMAMDRQHEDISEILDIHFTRETMWRNRNCLLKLYLTKNKSKFKPFSLGIFREIIKYA